MRHTPDVEDVRNMIFKAVEPVRSQLAQLTDRIESRLTSLEMGHSVVTAGKMREDIASHADDIEGLEARVSSMEGFMRGSDAALALVDLGKRCDALSVALGQIRQLARDESVSMAARLNEIAALCNGALK